MARKKGETCSFSVNMPKNFVEEIDRICAANYITRTSWIIKAAAEHLEKTRVKSTADILSRIKDIEQKAN